MTELLDISDDFAIVTDGLSTVQVGTKTVNNSLRRQIDVREAEKSGGKYLTSDVAFHLDAGQHSNRPVIGKAIVDSDGTWTILGVSKQTLGNRWRCVCRMLSLEASGVGSLERVNIQVANYSKSQTGAQEPSWSISVPDVPARVQIDSESMEVEHELRSTRKMATVWFASERELTANHRLAVIEDSSRDGMILKVLEWGGFDSINQLFFAKCEVSRWPQS